MKMKKIFNKALSRKLIAMGNPLIDFEPNHKKEGFIVYLFEDTEKLHEDLTKLTQK